MRFLILHLQALLRTYYLLPRDSRDSRECLSFFFSFLTCTCSLRPSRWCGVQRERITWPVSHISVILRLYTISSSKIIPSPVSRRIIRSLAMSCSNLKLFDSGSCEVLTRSGWHFHEFWNSSFPRKKKKDSEDQEVLSCSALLEGVELFQVVASFLLHTT